MADWNKNKVKQAQLKAVSNFNIALIELYWELGKEIISKQTEYKSQWGEKGSDNQYHIAFLLRISL